MNDQLYYINQNHLCCAQGVLARANFSDLLKQMSLRDLCRFCAACCQEG